VVSAVNGNQEYTAQFSSTVNSYSVRYLSVEDDDVYETISVKYGLEFVNDFIPTKEGHTFEGWYFESDFKRKFEKEIIIVDNLDLYAKWTINEHKVSFVDEVSNIKDNQTFYYGEIINELPEIELHDYRFDGWFFDEEFENGVTLPYEIRNDIVFYAKWTHITEIEFTVNFINWDGETLLTTKVFGKSDVQYNLENPEKKHDDWRYFYEFDGWDKELYNISSDLEVKAIYQEKGNKIIKTTSNYLIRENGDLYLLNSEKVISHQLIGTNVIDVAEGNNPISANEWHTLYITKDKALYSFGKNNSGQLGDGTVKNRDEHKKIGDDFIKVFASWNVSFAIKSDGTLYSWGGNSYYQLGLGHSKNTYIPTSTNQKYIDLAISFNGRGAIGIDLMGDLYSWGLDSNGILGSGKDQTIIEKIKIGSGFTSLSFNGFIGVAGTGIKFNGEVYSWGSNEYGDFGNGRSKYNNDQSIDLVQPISYKPIKTHDDFKSISGLAGITVGITHNNELYAWGLFSSFFNGNVTLGNGESNGSRTPVLITSNVKDFFITSLGVFYYDLNGDLYGWGNVVQIKNDNNPITYYTPVLIEKSYI